MHGRGRLGMGHLGPTRVHVNRGRHLGAWTVVDVNEQEDVNGGPRSSGGVIERSRQLEGTPLASVNGCSREVWPSVHKEGLWSLEFT